MSHAYLLSMSDYFRELKKRLNQNKEYLREKWRVGYEQSRKKTEVKWKIIKEKKWKEKRKRTIWLRP